MVRGLFGAKLGRELPPLGRELPPIAKLFARRNGGLMATPNKELRLRIDSMGDSEKLSIANYILERLDLPDPMLDKAWAKSRLKAMRSGEMKLFAYQDVMAVHLK
jgi:hypothetical protein